MIARRPLTINCAPQFLAKSTDRPSNAFIVTFPISLVTSANILTRDVYKRQALHDRVIEMEHFRSMQAGGSLQEETAELQKQSGLSKGKLLALAFAGAQASFPKKMPTIDELQQTAKWMYRYRPKQYEMLENAFCAVWDDLVCFPVKCRVSYEDSWMEERTYGGKRGHEGTDLMPPTNQRGFYPVFSATAGTVEHLSLIHIWICSRFTQTGFIHDRSGAVCIHHADQCGSDTNTEEGNRRRCKVRIQFIIKKHMAWTSSCTDAFICQQP